MNQTSAANHQFFGIAYENGTFVAVAFDGPVQTSPDGITWTNQTSAASNGW